MALPYITRAGYPISINSQDDLEKVCNLGTQIGYNTSDRDSFVTMTYLTPSTYTPKVFYVKGSTEGWFTAYAVVNKYDNSGYLCWAHYDTSGLETTYNGNFKSITSPGSAEGVNDVWYANIVGATDNIMLDQLVTICSISITKILIVEVIKKWIILSAIIYAIIFSCGFGKSCVRIICSMYCHSFEITDCK